MKKQEIYLAGGCYWGTEKYTKFEEILSAKLSKAPEKHNKCEHYVKKVVKKAIQ